MSEQRRKPGTASKALIVVALAVVVVAALVAKNISKEDTGTGAASQQMTSQTSMQESGAGSDERATAKQDSQDLAAQPLPKLVDLGAGKCIPCKMMAPILDELKEVYEGTFDVVFIDVWENPGAGDQYGIRLIPTQIFFDAQGNELFRHEGFYSKEEILGKWRDLGINVSETG